MNRTKLHELYGHLLEQDLLDEIEEHGVHRNFEAGERIIKPGDYLKSIPLLISGRIKVMRPDDDGAELLLYYLELGDTCSVSVNCCTGLKKSDIMAIAEVESEVILVPVEKMDEWMVRFRSWRSFILESFNIRMNEMLETIDSIAFMRMDERIHKYLLDKVKLTGDTELKLSHQDIADDLHTSRVVVSRLMKQLENEGKVKLGRNRVEVDFS